MASTEWLPALVLFADSNGDWERYLDALYAWFRADFIDGPARHFQGKRVGLKKHPVEKGKEATFWHMISEGKGEADRLPDLRRTERIRWPRPTMDNHTDSVVKVWKNRRRNEDRICLWIEADEYLVVLADRGNYVLPWTTYIVTGERRKADLQREYQAYWKSQGREV